MLHRAESEILKKNLNADRRTCPCTLTVYANFDLKSYTTLEERQTLGSERCLRIQPERGKGVTQLPFRRNDLGVTATGQRSGLTQLWRSVFQTPTLSNAALCISGFRFPVAVVCVCGWVGCWQLLKRDLFWLYQKGDSQPAVRRQSFGVQCIKCGESVWFTAMSHDFKGQIRTQFMRVCFSF